MRTNGLEIKPHADLRGADLRGADLRGAGLRGADLRGANLREADLFMANLRGANLRRANLNGANLNGADLFMANLFMANLNGAALRGAGLANPGMIDGGQDRRGYRFVMVPHDDGPRVAAGCRWFTLYQARHHWARESLVSLNARECLRKVEMMAAEARARGWPAPEGGW